MFGRFRLSGLSPGSSRPPSERLPDGTPKALQGRSLGRLGCLLEALGPLWETTRPPKGTPEFINMKPVTQN